jgi:hypothetical protein
MSINSLYHAKRPNAERLLAISANSGALRTCSTMFEDMSCLRMPVVSTNKGSPADFGQLRNAADVVADFLPQRLAKAIRAC